MADIDVVEQHMRRAVEAVVHDAVLDQDLVRADLRLDAADQVEVLAEHGRLLDDAFAPQRAALAIPALAIADEPAGDRRDAAMERMGDALAVGIVKVLRRLLLHQEDVVEPAGDEQARE